MVFRYPGGKNSLLPAIRQKLFPLLKQNGIDSYHDVFVGGGSVLVDVAKNFPDLKLYANDKDPTISSFWKVIAKGSSKQIDDLMDLVNQKPTVSLFNELRSKKPRTQTEKAYYAIFFNRCTFSGIATSGPIGGQKQESDWTIDCRYNKEKIKKGILDMIYLFKDRLKVSQLDCVKYLENNSNFNSVFYLDPPYYKKGKELYPVFMKEKSHKNLSQSIKNIDKWLLSYDICDEIDDLYSWAKKTPLDARYSISGVKTTWKNKKEYLITF